MAGNVNFHVIVVEYVPMALFLKFCVCFLHG